MLGDSWLRVERVGDATLYLRARDETLLPPLPADAAIVSDPPWGISYEHGEVRRSGLHRRQRTGPASRVLGDDRPFDPAHLVATGRPCLLFGADRYRLRLPGGGSFHGWDKSVGKGPADDFADIEFFWTSWKCKARCLRHLWKGVLRQGNDGSPRWHVSEKPVPVMAHCLAMLPAGVGAVVDPYCGSGSTGVACALAGRPFVGVELDPAHFETALRRVEAAHRQGDMLLPARRPPAPGQPDMLAAAERAPRTGRRARLATSGAGTRAGPAGAPA